MGRKSEPRWWAFLDGEEAPPLALHGIRALRRVYAHLPGDPRCKFCAVPFSDPWRRILGAFGKGPSTLTPYLCMACETKGKRQGGGGEARAALVFADIRGSTTLADHLPPHEFAALVDRFYRATTDAMVRADGWIEKLAGDEVTAVFFPGFAGEDYVAKAVSAARRVVSATGHDDDHPWVPVGVGVHCGRVVMRVVGETGGAIDYAVLGDDANVAARITAQAGVGEILLSEPAVRAAGLDPVGLETRSLELKGKPDPVRVTVLGPL